MNDLFVTGTDTGVGKTVLSALLTRALDAVYWKPIQTGAAEEEGIDRHAVLEMTGLDPDRTRPERYIFDPPVSPHLAARWAHSPIDMTSIRRPGDTGGRRLVIEGAGGVLVPVSDDHLMIDLIAQLGAPVVVAARTSLGTINHTLMTLGALDAAAIPVRGVVIIGPENGANREAIERYGNAPLVGWIPMLERIDPPALDAVFRNHFDRSAFDD